MCGIAGFYGFENKNLISKISQELAHRGPDGEGIFSNGIVTLLNRRLAIIDLKTGDQPKYNEDRSIVVVYNGEIYNYKELREELQKRKYRFYTESDTEIIVRGYQEWGEECFDRFNGMFAIAIYDRKKEKLILARDHFGIKPLYYSIKDSELIFSSEIKPIFYSGLIKKEPNERIIFRYLKYRVHDDQEETFFKGIKKLLPGQMMTIDGDGFRVKDYSNLKENLKNSTVHKDINENEESKKFRENFIKAVQLRLISDVQVGTCLSGGLDSSTVVSVINKLLKAKVSESASIGKIQKTFSAVFPGSSNDEEKYIDDLLKKTPRVKNFKIKPTPQTFINELQKFITAQEEPTISSGPYAQYKVMEEASKHVKVVLDGQGSDEMLAGYDPYFFVYLRQLLKEKKYLKFIQEALAAWDIVSKYLRIRLRRALGFKKEVDLNKVLSSPFTAKYQSEQFRSVNNNLKQRLIDDIFHDSLPSLLRYEDKNSMGFSIEGRVPFLDFNLVKYIFSFSEEAFIKNGWNKNILRNAFEDLLPKSILKRRNKVGFTTPEQEWFKNLTSEIYSILLSESFAGRKYFNRQEILRQYELFTEGKNDDTLLFWRLINLEIWLRIFFDQKKKEKNKEAVRKITVNGKVYDRYPIKTKLFQKGDNYVKEITAYVLQQKIEPKKKWFVAVSEKIIAISQGRSYFLWEIKPSRWAKILSKSVKKTPSGIGIGSPWTMQLAIDEVGLTKILLASVASLVTRPFGFKGVFYHVAGREVAAIDGPTEYSLYPSNVSAKRAPKDPQKVAEKIHEEVLKKLASQQKRSFSGVIIIDANDLGQNILGNSTNLDNLSTEKIFFDNPLGQAKEQTPLAIVYF